MKKQPFATQYNYVPRKPKFIGGKSMTEPDHTVSILDLLKNHTVGTIPHAVYFEDQEYPDLNHMDAIELAQYNMDLTEDIIKLQDEQKSIAKRQKAEQARIKLAEQNSRQTPNPDLQT